MGAGASVLIDSEGKVVIKDTSGNSVALNEREKEQVSVVEVRLLYVCCV